MQTTLLSTGIDIGTATTGMVISRLCVKNTAGMFTVPHMSIVDKEVIYKSRIYSTPLLDEYHIDVERIKQLLETEYQNAGIRPEQLETGAVIITGESAVKENAKNVLDALSSFAGEFVVATAGPDLESVISGQGSGAQQYSKEHSCTVLNIDIGGGTSNFALFDCGTVKARGCCDIGGRLVKVDEKHTVYAISPRVLPIAAQAGVALTVGQTLTEQDAQKLTAVMAEVLGELLTEAPLSPLAQTLRTRGSSALDVCAPQQLSFSGGVAELLDSPPNDPFRYGDLGVFLAAAIEHSSWYQRANIIVPHERIRATVVGAGSHTTTLSGSTISISAAQLLPVKNLPVLTLTEQEEKQTLSDGGQQLSKKLRWFLGQTDSDNAVIAFSYIKNPSYQELRQLAKSISAAAQAALPENRTIFVLCEHDFAKALGQALRRAAPNKSYISIDGVAAGQGDYLDIGHPIVNGIAVPVVVKTLITG